MNMEARIRGIGMTSQRTRLRLVQRLRDAGIVDEQVLEAMTDVPRHCFVDEALEHRAYEDCSLPIGEGQTISQPYVVALMTQLVLASGGLYGPVDRVLEIGTGSGYQAAVLARVVSSVHTLERVKNLSNRAINRFRQLGERNIHAKYADGVDGWSDQAPFDAIIVTAAMAEVPQSLLDQVRPGGVLIGPVGPQQGRQVLSVLRCVEDAPPVVREIEQVRFVPFLPGRC